VVIDDHEEPPPMPAQPKHPQGRNTARVIDAERLRRLGAAFAEYRRVHGAGRWIPQGLRAQVLAAHEAGISANAIRRACKLSSTQLARWRASTRVHEAATPPVATVGARVLSVVEARPAASAAEPPLQLQVGAWRVCISRVAP
jgi:hypothetical protein